MDPLVKTTASIIGLKPYISALQALPLTCLSFSPSLIFLTSPPSKIPLMDPIVKLTASITILLPASTLQTPPLSFQPFPNFSILTSPTPKIPLIDPIVKPTASITVLHSIVTGSYQLCTRTLLVLAPSLFFYFLLQLPHPL